MLSQDLCYFESLLQHDVQTAGIYYPGLGLRWNKAMYHNLCPN